MIKANSYVRIEKTIIEAKDRVSKIPEDTKSTPFKIWTKGILLEDALLNSECQIKTITGRIETGILIEDEPVYELNFGKFLPEIIEIDLRLKNE